VVAVCGTLATSAAYIVALAADRIFVYGNTITGSVGVIFNGPRSPSFCTRSASRSKR
jgi:protease-4